MSKKFKLYLQYGEEQINKSFFDELDRYNEISSKIVINRDPSLSFVGILKWIKEKYKTSEDILNFKEGQKFVNKSKNTLKYSIHKIDYESMIITLISELKDDSKIWFGFRMKKIIRNATVYEFFEGFVSKKTSSGLPLGISNFTNKRKLKDKVLYIENEINKSFE